MSFLDSIIFGEEGSYEVLGIDVSFQEIGDSRQDSLVPLTSNSRILSVFIKFLRYATGNSLNSRVFRIVTQGYAHTFIHEMGHALACRVLTDQKTDIRIFTDCGAGGTSIEDPEKLSPKIDSIIAISGPMAGMAFSSCKLVAATALRSYLSTPLAVTIGAGAVVWMTAELFAAYISASDKDGGDFGRIARNSSIHLSLASTALIGECALGIFAAYKFV